MPRLVRPRVYRVSRMNTSTMDYSESVVGFLAAATIEHALEDAKDAFDIFAPIVQPATECETLEFWK